MSSLLFDQPELTHEYLARVALDVSSHHLQQLQEAVNLVFEACNGGENPSPKMLKFLTALFDNPWWGGKDLGYNYAQQHWGQQHEKPVNDIKQPHWAQLQNHFVSGSGQKLAVNRQLYQSSRMVQDVVIALKLFIKKQHKQNRAVNLITTQTKDFLISSEALKLEDARRNNETLGYIFNDGSLMIEQKDPRLNRVFDRFMISAFTTLSGNQFMTRWRIDGLYAFTSFAQSSGKTGLVLHDQAILQIPFALGHVLAEQGGAKNFEYFTDWMEWYGI